MMAEQAEKRLAQALIEVNDINQLDGERLLQIVKTNGFVCVRGLNAPERVREAMSRLQARFDASLDHPSLGEKPEAIMRPFQKLNLAGVPPADGEQYGRKVKIKYFPRFYRTIYMPFWCEDRFDLHESLRNAASVRNIVYGLSEDYCIDEVQDGWWSAARIHQYPRGGGFLVPHKDTTLPSLQLAARFSGFYQPFVILSKRGEDFDCGGGFFDIEGERFFYEEVCELGDIIVFDQRTIHGVEDVDPYKKMDLTELNGRVAGFVSFYKDLR